MMLKYAHDWSTLGQSDLTWCTRCGCTYGSFSATHGCVAEADPILEAVAEELRQERDADWTSGCS